VESERPFQQLINHIYIAGRYKKMHCLKKPYTNLKQVSQSFNAINKTICIPALVLSVFLLTVNTSSLQAQNTSLTVDEQYELARNEAFEEGDYKKARELAYLALERSPDYHGIRIFIASLYGWEGRYNKASEELKTVLEADPENRRALLSIIDIESRAENFSEALHWVSIADNYYLNDHEFLMKEAAVHNSAEDYPKAESLYRVILSSEPSSSEARLALESVRLKQMKHTASLSYRYDRFNQILDPWSFMEFSLSRQTSLGSVTGRIQYANRFATNGAQFNLDAYPSITNGFYAYISGGYSDSSIYPRFQFGLSLYKSLPFALEIEGGIRYLNFTTSETYIYTASLSKYRGSYMFTGRTYFIPSSLGNSLSGNLLIRRYFSSAQSYVGISGGYGNASNDIQFAEEISTLNSWSLSLEAQYPLNNRFLLSGIARIDSEELQAYIRERISFKAGLSYRF